MVNDFAFHFTKEPHLPVAHKYHFPDTLPQLSQEQNSKVHSRSSQPQKAGGIMLPSFQGTQVELGGCWLRIPMASRSPGLIAYLIQAALQDDNQGEGDGVQAEEGVITVNGVHTVGVFEEELFLLGWG